MLRAVSDSGSDGSPSHADPVRYAELTSFGNDYRDLWHNADFLALTARRWGLGEQTRLLDVGCGAGQWGLSLLPYLSESATLTGVDRQPAFFERAAELASQRGLSDRVEFGEATTEALPFKDGTFDVVTCRTLLMHVADPAAAVAEMVRVTRPGGVVLCCEPDNLAGDIALLGTSMQTSDDDVVAIVRLLLTCQAGKVALGEGDERIGHRLPALFSEAGLAQVDAHVNDRCMVLHPPYERPDMQVAIETEIGWARQGLAIFAGTRDDARRLHRAASSNVAAFERGWSAIERWRTGFMGAIETKSFSAARGYVMYMVGGRKPG